MHSNGRSIKWHLPIRVGIINYIGFSYIAPLVEYHNLICSQAERENVKEALEYWIDSPYFSSDDTGVSADIRKYVEEQESKTTCSRILGRILRNSWKNRVEVVNSADANVVVSALLNITMEKVSKIGSR